MNRHEQYSLLLLAGGKSSRMGEDKAQLMYKEKTFLQALIEKAEKVGITQMYLSGHDGDEEKVQIVWDIYPECGPLGGLHACMRKMKTPYCLVLPVDVPQIPQELLEKLLSCHEQQENFAESKQLPLLVKHGDRLEHLIGIYPITMVDFIEEKIKNSQLAVHRMLKEWGVNRYGIELPEWQIENVNTQEAYQMLLRFEERK